ncbi:uncharacterized protein MELLADRAFT_108534 [Melampsora larici-populina 98AG31]|uniref:Uncharacterized protein n=1 Tax=Melampsora larici-populina (strain 98AG31 / pathotype 3-4-7) TaxID=747676 RepID=F4RTE3_MELLP|nr:uncharacterized protein MELLADRAFT_108534 [Melampsora larici-populina 98AG31]EGG04353.1 hypothetical protein MELLADRAFT_108534 [Melampsora larici-populina 98AG31]
MANNLSTVTASAVKGPTLKPSSVVSSTASLNESIGVPGWQIVHHGDLPVVTLSNGGQSLIGYNAGIQTVRNRKRREKDFELNTLELKRKSDLWNLQTNLPLRKTTTTTK